MITSEQDPDVVRWSHQLFDCDPYSNYAYSSGTLAPQNDAVDCYRREYFKEDHGCDSVVECHNVENDELVAHSLQQEFLRLSAAEAPESSPGDEEEADHLQASSNFPQEWYGQPMGMTYNPEQGNPQEEMNDMVPSTSCSSSPGEDSYYGEDWSYSLDLTDEYALDGEMGKRLNQMASVPHVPKINGDIPSVDEATLDHQRLLGRLQLYDLVELKVHGDGNCQFRALSDQLYRTSEHHEFVRQEVVNQLKSCPESYEGYVPMAYDEYIEKMSKNGEWGDHVTLQAAADSYGVKIFVITSFKDTCYIEILPNEEKSKRVICLSFWAEVHYNSVYPQGDVPVLETKKKKRWRMFRNRHLESPEELKQ